MTAQTVAALQIGASPEGKEKTLEHILAFEAEIASSGAAPVSYTHLTLPTSDLV